MTPYEYSEENIGQQGASYAQQVWESALQQTTNDILNSAYQILESWGISLIVLLMVVESWTFLWLLSPWITVLFAVWMIYGSFWYTERGFLVILIFCIIWWIAWDILWYRTWHKLWASIYEKEDTRYYKKTYLLKVKWFFDSKWEEIIFYARLIPYVWSLVPMICWTLKVDLIRFIIKSSSASIFWITIMLWWWYALTKYLPSMKRAIPWILLAIYVWPEIFLWVKYLISWLKSWYYRIIWAKEEIIKLQHDMWVITHHFSDLRTKLQQSWATRLLQEDKTIISQIQPVSNPGQTVSPSESQLKNLSK